MMYRVHIVKEKNEMDIELLAQGKDYQLSFSSIK